MAIQIPYKFDPRPYQLELFKAMDSGYKRAIVVWHRRCLAEGTMITMADGSLKPIQDIKVGDYVKSYDRVTGSWQDKKVKKVFCNGTRKVFDYNGLKATKNHKVFDGRDFVPISKAKFLFTADGKTIARQEPKEAGRCKVYDLNVDRNHNYLANGFLVHNCGKDKTLWNLVIKKALERKGTYYYFFPEFSQGKRVIWDGLDGSGLPFMAHLPDAVVKKKYNTDMKIILVNDSVIKIVGTDRFDAIRGSNPVGCVFSEAAFQNPAAWDVVRPILAENGGWAVFNSSVNGKNHFYHMVQSAKEDPDWFVQNLTVDDTKDWDGNPIITPEAIEAERKAGMSEEMIRQEFYNDFLANSEAYYFLKKMNELRKKGQIGKFPYDPTKPVATFWDIGVRDKCAIWFVQRIEGVYYLIDFYEDSQKGLPEYARVLQRKPYIYSTHTFPHDMAVTEFGSGRTRIEQAYRLFKGAKVITAPKVSFKDGVEAARVILDQCYFNEPLTKTGIHALENYKRSFNKRTGEYSDSPVHDFASHAADAFRYFALNTLHPHTNRTKQRFSRFKTINRRDWRLA